MGLSKDIWKSKHASRTQIRGNKTISKHKSGGALGIKSSIAEGDHPCLPLFRILQVATQQNGEELGLQNQREKEFEYQLCYLFEVRFSTIYFTSEDRSSFGGRWMSFENALLLIPFKKSRYALFSKQLSNSCNIENPEIRYHSYLQGEHSCIRKTCKYVPIFKCSHFSAILIQDCLMLIFVSVYTLSVFHSSDRSS